MTREAAEALSRARQALDALAQELVSAASDAEDAEDLHTAATYEDAQGDVGRAYAALDEIERALSPTTTDN